jgi:hypothetical protein
MPPSYGRDVAIAAQSGASEYGEQVACYFSQRKTETETREGVVMVGLHVLVTIVILIYLFYILMKSIANETV